MLFGAVNPSGRLPVTFPNKENEQGMTPEQYPGVKTAEFDLQATYTEGQMSGYRWYDKHGVEPAFAFGHDGGATLGEEGEIRPEILAAIEQELWATGTDNCTLVIIVCFEIFKLL